MIKHGASFRGGAHVFDGRLGILYKDAEISTWTFVESYDIKARITSILSDCLFFMLVNRGTPGLASETGETIIPA